MNFKTWLIPILFCALFAHGLLGTPKTCCAENSQLDRVASASNESLDDFFVSTEANSSVVASVVEPDEESVDETVVEHSWWSGNSAWWIDFNVAFGCDSEPSIVTVRQGGVTGISGVPAGYEMNITETRMKPGSVTRNVRHADGKCYVSYTGTILIDITLSATFGIKLGPLNVGPTVEYNITLAETFTTPEIECTCNCPPPGPGIYIYVEYAQYTVQVFYWLLYQFFNYGANNQ